MKELKPLLLYMLGVCVIIVVVGVLTNQNQGKPLFGNFDVLINDPATSDPTYKKITVGNTDLSVVVADSPEERKVGLSETVSLDDDEGMLFVFDAQDTQPIFWMKDMEMDIDIIWINDGKIVKIDPHVRAPEVGVSDSQLKLYKPNGPVDYVLETAAGWSEKHSIKVNDEVDL